VELTEGDWANPDLHTLGMLRSGVSLLERDDEGAQIRGNTLLLLLNAQWKAVSFMMPWASFLHPWELVLDTSLEEPMPNRRLSRFKRSYDLAPWSVALLRFYEST
jgi:glycogen operon protein